MRPVTGAAAPSGMAARRDNTHAGILSESLARLATGRCAQQEGAVIEEQRDSIVGIAAEIVGCRVCPRLVAWREQVARERRAAFRDQEYWGRPVPGFGDPHARMLLVALAPAAHGANRTGRVFTGDGPHGSGDFLMAALHRAGFANIPTAQRADDGLELTDAFIAAAVRCAPPDNKPTTEEIANCRPHLDAEIAALPRIQVVVALGKIGFDAYLQLLKRRGVNVRPKPAFGHDVAHALPNGETLIGCYHPSRQNTNTGKLTARMMDAVFERAARALCDADQR